MLERQMAEIAGYPAEIRVIVVDDGGPEPAEPIVRDEPGANVELYRIDKDVPWNREGARNLGATVAQDGWIVHVDIDHVLPVAAAHALLDFVGNDQRAYRFPRYRVGKADETRKKDRIPDDADFGPIHPHVDSYLCTKELYWRTGGYNEDFAGVLGGGNEFLRRLEKTAERILILPEPICLHVHTRSVIKDASDWACSRDGEPGKALWRKLQREGNTRPKDYLRFPWHRVL